MSEYPKMLFRPGSQIHWEGKHLDTHVVHDADAEASARAEGWAAASEPKKAKKK